VSGQGRIRVISYHAVIMSDLCVSCVIRWMVRWGLLEPGLFSGLRVNFRNICTVFFFFMCTRLVARNGMLKQ